MYKSILLRRRELPRHPPGRDHHSSRRALAAPHVRRNRRRPPLLRERVARTPCSVEIVKHFNMFVLPSRATCPTIINQGLGHCAAFVSMGHSRLPLCSDHDHGHLQCLPPHPPGPSNANSNVLISNDSQEPRRRPETVPRLAYSIAFYEQPITSIPENPTLSIRSPPEGNCGDPGRLAWIR